ncbi:hypothetical protein B0T14DRAFT_440046 [Immersiella caudata]|uniref:Uncharacterized protein n=1 Tax=Immersiella caudata TaxID=314043 RepID=A0AA39TXR3_9PEZI|nr:hypothetical protein B0T14DRAFT_440046 [Immersiella caudata]
MSDHHRGRSRRGYYDDDYYYEEKPRHRSLGRQALVKLEDAMGGLALEKFGSHSKGHHDALRHTRDSHWDRDYHHPRAYHSVSPVRHHHHSHRSHHDHHHHDRDHRGRRESRHSHHSSSSRSRSRWDRGITAAVDAAALEAFRLRREPGPWKGKKGSRIATAAISAGVIGAATEHYHGKRHGDHGHDHDLGRKGALGSAIGGLMVNRLVNGSRSEVRR